MNQFCITLAQFHKAQQKVSFILNIIVVPYKTLPKLCKTHSSTIHISSIQPYFPKFCCYAKSYQCVRPNILKYQVWNPIMVTQIFRFKSVAICFKFHHNSNEILIFRLYWILTNLRREVQTDWKKRKKSDLPWDWNDTRMMQNGNIDQKKR